MEAAFFRTVQKDRHTPSMHPAPISGSRLPSATSSLRSPGSYRIGVTYKDPMVFEKVQGSLIQIFHGPTYSKRDVDHWAWRNDSLVILQREPFLIQISYMNGPFLRMSHDEGGT